MPRKKTGKALQEKVLRLVYKSLAKDEKLLELAKMAIGIPIPKKPKPFMSFLKNGERVPDSVLKIANEKIKTEAFEEISKKFEEAFGIIFTEKEELEFVLKKYIDSLPPE